MEVFGYEVKKKPEKSNKVVLRQAPAPGHPEHSRQSVVATPLVASSPALLRTYSMKAMWEDTLKRTHQREVALGLKPSIPSFPQAELDRLEMEVDEDDDPDDENEDGLVETRFQKFARADRKLAQAHVAARVREAAEERAKKRQTAEQAELSRLKARLAELEPPPPT